MCCYGHRRCPSQQRTSPIRRGSACVVEAELAALLCSLLLTGGHPEVPEGTLADEAFKQLPSCQPRDGVP